jgi:hypothetical protein
MAFSNDSDRHGTLERIQRFAPICGTAPDNIDVMFNALCFFGQTATQGLVYDAGDAECHAL